MLASGGNGPSRTSADNGVHSDGGEPMLCVKCRVSEICRVPGGMEPPLNPVRDISPYDEVADLRRLQGWPARDPSPLVAREFRTAATRRKAQTYERSRARQPRRQTAARAAKHRVAPRAHPLAAMTSILIIKNVR